MSSGLFWLLSFCGFVALSLACGLLVWPQLSVAWPSIEEKIDRFRRLPPLAKVALLVFVAGFIAYGSTKTNQVSQVKGEGEGEQRNLPTCSVGQPEQESNILCSPSPLTFTSTMPTVTPEDVARGWQVWEVRTNCNVTYTMPDGATLATNWWVRGAYEDVKPFDFGSWRFPFGTNEYSSLWAFSWGKIRFTLADTNEIIAVGTPMSAVPYRSRLWTATDTNGSQLVTWENFALNRDTNTPVNAQIELRANGGFVTRSNEVETVCRRVDPDDYDGDGWRNDDDPDPYNPDDFYDMFSQELPEGANEAAYYWVDIRPRWNSDIGFYGDAPSNLVDPYVCGKAGETYRVRLLVGKTYFVESSQPVDIVGRSSPSIEVDGDGTCELEIVWPVSFTALEGNGASFLMRVVPAGLNGTFEWSQHCCAITGYGNQFWWAHNRYCWCFGCRAQGWYSYEGYALECVGGHCCCPGDDDDPYESQEDDGPYAAGASVEFSAPVVIFEDAYTNMPGEVVARQSTRTTLTCVAHGGETGGTAMFSIENGAKLVSCSGGSLPVTRFVPPQQKIEFEIVYEGKLPSGSERDIIAKADFTERGTGTRQATRDDRMTSVQVELEAVHVAVENPNVNRHVFGVGEDAIVKISPLLGLVDVSSSLGLLEDLHGGQARYKAPDASDTVVFTVSYGNVKKETLIDIFEPDGYVVHSIIASFESMPNEAGLIDLNFTNRLCPLCVSFYAVEVTEIAMVSTNAVGYFAQPEHVDDLDHGKHGAYGQWSPVREDNSTDDLVRMGYCSKPWNGGGSFTWPIPNAWRVAGDPSSTNVFTHTDQRFELDADGTARVSKFGWTGERGTNDTHRVYGSSDR